MKRKSKRVMLAENRAVRKVENIDMKDNRKERKQSKKERKGDEKILNIFSIQEENRTISTSGRRCSQLPFRQSNGNDVSGNYCQAKPSPSSSSAGWL